MNARIFQINCQGIFLVIIRQQLKPNIEDWITTDHKIVAVKFLNCSKLSFKSQPENNCNFTSGNFIADSAETLSLRVYTVLEAVAVQAGVVIHTQKHTSLHAWTKT